MEALYAGGCQCGQVTWRASAEPINVRVCHCRKCQKAMGSPFFARALFHAADVTRSGDVVRWASSQRLHRLACANCGTPVFAEPQDGPWLAVALATLNDPATLKPGSHVWVSRKLDWVTLADGLPQFAEGA